MEDMIPRGYCQCGCGEKTKLAPQTDPDKGWVLRQPMKYIAGHQNKRPMAPPLYRIEDTGYETPCWRWQGYIAKEGYARMKVNSERIFVHRVNYERKYGPIPEGLQPHHECDIRDCVNPDHITPVTPAENVRRSKSAKLNESVVKEMRQLLRATSLTQREIAERFAVNQSTVWAVKEGRTWRGVGE